MDDIIEKLFKKDYIRTKEEFIQEIELIRQQLLKCESDVKIDCYDIGIDEVIKKKQDNNYLSDYNIKYMDNGISFLFLDNEMFALIKDYIPKTITKLEIPLEIFMSNIDFFKTFPNLKTLVINDYTKLAKDDFDKILTASNIREILCKNIVVYSQYYRQGDFVNASYPYDCLCYNDIMLSSTDDTINRPSSRLEILSSNFNQQNFERIYDKFKSNKTINEVNIMLNNGNNYKIKFLDDRTIDSIVINDGNIDIIHNFYNYLVNKGYKINNIIIDVSDINYEDIDLSSLMKIKEECNITFKYSTLEKADFDDFLGLVEAIKWYRSMIDDEMSPAEKLMFAYDILKTFEYHENKYNKNNSRAPHNIIRDGDIVCAGYTSLRREILKNIDDNLKVGAVSVTCYDKNGEPLGYHSRGFVSIDDDKYDIHGIFIDDPTWDSYKHSRKERLDKDYNALDLYQYFLISKTDYHKIFPYDSIPNIFKKGIEANDKGVLSTDLSLVDEYNMALYDSPLKNKDNITSEEIENRINMARRPSLATFNEILYNVRLKEGYSINQAHDDMDRVNKENIDLSIMISELAENNFFKDSKGDINKK